MQTDVNVAQVAELARLKPSPTQVTRFTGQIANILSYMQKLQEADTTCISEAEVLHVTENNLRKDGMGECLSQEQALQNAPVRTHDLFSVSKIVE